MKMRLKMENRSHRYETNRLRLRHGHKYTIYKMYFSIMNSCIMNKAQFMKTLSNTEGELKKKCCL